MSTHFGPEIVTSKCSILRNSKHISSFNTERNVWALSWLWWPWAVTGQYAMGGGVHYRTALFSGEAICYTLAAVTLCTLLWHSTHPHFTVLLSAHCQLTALPIRSPSLLLLMVIPASCLCHYQFLTVSVCCALRLARSEGGPRGSEFYHHVS